MGRLELSIPEIRFLRRYSVENCLSHEIFGVHHLVYLGNDRFGLFPLDDDDAVDGGKNKITGPDRDALDLNRLSKRFERPSAGDVPRCLEPGKYGEIQLSDKCIITAPAVDDVTPYSPEMQGFGGEFAHKSEVVIPRLANNDVSFRRSAQEFCPSAVEFICRFSLRFGHLLYERPPPTSPPKARISPLCTLKEMSRTAGNELRFLTSKTGEREDRPAARSGRLGETCFISCPTMRRIRSDCLKEAV